MLMLRIMRDTDRFPEIEAKMLQGDLFYIALNGDELLGYCRFRRGLNSLYITEVVDKGDAALGDGLIRSTLAYGMDSGVDQANFLDFVDMTRYARFGYRFEEGKCINSIVAFLNNCSSCQSEE